MFTCLVESRPKPSGFSTSSGLLQLAEEQLCSIGVLQTELQEIFSEGEAISVLVLLLV